MVRVIRCLKIKIKKYIGKMWKISTYIFDKFIKFGHWLQKYKSNQLFFLWLVEDGLKGL